MGYTILGGIVLTLAFMVYRRVQYQSSFRAISSVWGWSPTLAATHPNAQVAPMPAQEWPRTMWQCMNIPLRVRKDPIKKSGNCSRNMIQPGTLVDAVAFSPDGAWIQHRSMKGLLGWTRITSMAVAGMPLMRQVQVNQDGSLVSQVEAPVAMVALG